MALALVSVAILSVLALSISVARMNQESVDQGVGGLVATQILDGLVEKMRADPSGPLRRDFLEEEHTSTPFAEGKVVNNGTEFEYEVFARTVLNTDGDPVGGAIGRRLKKVDVVLSWWDSKDTQRQGYGKLQLTHSRLVGEAEL